MIADKQVLVSKDDLNLGKRTIRIFELLLKFSYWTYDDAEKTAIISFQAPV